jgi:glyoxylase-like metal-dependent hydrolase (beta-lactamase superfamily II)
VHQHDAPVYTSVEALDRFTGISTILGPDALKNEEHLFRMKIAPDRTFQDGDEFNFNGITFRMVHTPGHSPGHSCFYFPDERFLYLADIDLTDFGPWYGNPSANLDDFIASIEKVKSIDADYYLSAHEAGLMDREDFLVKMEKFSSHISRRDELILEFLSEPRTLQDILSRRIIYPKVMKNKTDVWITYAERRMIEQHIVRLKRAGAIREENGKFLRT